MMRVMIMIMMKMVMMKVSFPENVLEEDKTGSSTRVMRCVS